MHVTRVWWWVSDMIVVWRAPYCFLWTFWYGTSSWTSRRRAAASSRRAVRATVRSALRPAHCRRAGSSHHAVSSTTVVAARRTSAAWCASSPRLESACVSHSPEPGQWSVRPSDSSWYMQNSYTYITIRAFSHLTTGKVHISKIFFKLLKYALFSFTNYYHLRFFTDNDPFKGHQAFMVGIISHHRAYYLSVA